MRRPSGSPLPVLFSLPVVLALALLLPAPASAGDGMWSRSAMSIPQGRPFLSPSPDRSRSIVVSGLKLALVQGGQPVTGGEDLGILLPADLGWSPDSKAFFLTSSDGGAEGRWDVALFLIENERLNYYDIGRVVRKRMESFFPCLGDTGPDVVAVRFLKDSKQLLLAAVVPSASACSARGYARGFIIDLPSGSVVRELEQKALWEDWGEFLGPKFQSRPAP